jgi:hypothetical protein
MRLVCSLSGVCGRLCAVMVPVEVVTTRAHHFDGAYGPAIADLLVDRVGPVAVAEVSDLPEIAVRLARAVATVMDCDRAIVLLSPQAMPDPSDGLGCVASTVASAALKIHYCNRSASRSAP